MKRLVPLLSVAAAVLWLIAPAAAAESFPVSIRVDASQPKGELHPIWRFFGADEPNYAYMKDGKKLIAELGELAPKSVYFRTHNLLTSGDGTPALKWGSTGVYREDADGKPVYDWTILDRIFDTYLERGVRPYVEIGFMPKDLSTKPEPYQHKWRPGAPYNEIYTGWAYPPKDYGKWAELVFQWAKHSSEKYGREEVEKWYWEVWNEANIAYWRGTPQEFYKLHDYAVDAVRRAVPGARVGGPDSAGGGRWLRDFLDHCVNGSNAATGKQGTPIDFVSFHAKGAPTFVEGHVRMGIANQLRGIDQNFGIIASFPQLNDKPIVIGESDPDGCAACQGPQLGYRNTTMYSSYTAASFARKHELAEKHGVNLEGALTWAFEFEDQPYFAGFRVLATNGIDQPVLNVFRMFAKMSGRRLAVESDGAVAMDAILRDGVRGKPDVSALASLDKDKLCVFAWHYHDDDVPGPAAEVEIALNGLPAQAARARVRQFRIDEEHSNAFTAWKRMGSPPQPNPQQYAELEKAGRLAEAGGSEAVRVEGGKATLHLALPRQAVALLVLDWAAADGVDAPQTRPATRPQDEPRRAAVPELRGLLSKPQNEVRAVAQRYEADRASLNRSYTFVLSPTRRARLKLFYKDWLDALDKLDASKLSEEGRGERSKLKETVQGEGHRLDEEATKQAEILPLVPFASVVIDLEESRRRLESMDAQKAAGTVTALRQQIEQSKKLLEAKPSDDARAVDKSVAARAADATAAVRNTLKSWFGFYNDYDPLFTWWMAQPYKEADQALADYAALLLDKPVYAPAADDKPDTGRAPSPVQDVPIKLAGREPDVPSLNELIAQSQSEMRGVIQAYPPNRGGAARPQGPSRQFLDDWLAYLEKLDFDALSRDGQVDYILLRSRIEADLARLKLRENPPAVPRLKDDSGITGRPIGREGLQVELTAEMIPYSPDELIDLAENEYAWCEAEMKKASAAMGFGDDWKKAVEKVKTMYVPPGRQPDLIRDLAWEAIEYVERDGLVTVPQVARESWRMQMMSPQRQLVNPFFTGGEVISVSYPTAQMAYDAKLQSMRGNNIPFSRATVFHELVPGHHLQQFMNARYQTQRRPFGTPFWGEGWALYWEMLLYDRGFPQTPEHRVGMLFWRMHRCARIVFSLGFHSGRMSPKQCIDYLVDKVGHERDNATAEVRRSFGGGYGPLYQAAYMLGGLQFRSMHKELVESGQMTDRQFHDAILKENSMPVTMARAILTGERLTRNYKPDWKFYGPTGPKP